MIEPLHAATPLAPACHYLANTDFDAATGSTQPSKSREECCRACAAEVSCLAGVYQPSSSTCFLKGDFITRNRSKAGVTACVARPSPPPPPVFDCAAPGADCAGRLGATHWNPCYPVNTSVPSLIDGALTVLSMGSRVVKVAAFDPRGNYPFNSPRWPTEPSAFPSLLSMVQHEYYTQLFSLPFTTFVLIAYSTVGGPAGGDISYWTNGITAAQAAEETNQLREATAYLLRRYAHKGKRFILENWEGDWASRAGSWDPAKPATPQALAAMRTWLEARQAGVTLGRGDFENTARVRAGARGIGTAFFAAEVNLVDTSRLNDVPNMINRVVPYVALDMVSYSSYDSQEGTHAFRANLAYIVAQHSNRTSAAPMGSAALFIAEFGLAQNHVSHSLLAHTITNVVETALSFGAAHVLFWETYCNECTNLTMAGCSGGSPNNRSPFRGRGGAGAVKGGLRAGGAVGLAAGRCHDAQHPIVDPAALNGFWLRRPDGSFAWPYEYMASKIGECE